MKKHISIAVSTLVISSFLVVGCSSRQSSEDSVSNAPTTVVAKDNVVSISVVDTNGVAVPGVKITIKGTATDVGGSTITTLTTAPITGLVSFYSKIGETVRVLTSATGYVDSGSELKIVEGANNKIIRIVKFDPKAKVAGIEMEDANVSVNALGTVTAELNVTVDDGSAGATPVTVITIPKDTVLKTEDGHLVSGKVKVEAVHYDDNSTESFPGGLVALASDVPANQNGTGEKTTQEVNFVSAGFTSITIKDDKGNSVKNFGDKKITIAMTLPKTTINPESGNLVQANDQIPIWSYNVSTGKWKYEELGKVIQNPNDKNTWAVIYQASHLSYWNLDWHYSPVCKPAHINITDLPANTDKITSLEIKGRGFNKTVFDYNGDGYYDLDNVPKTIPLTFSLKYDGSVKDAKSVTLGNACKVDLTLGNVTPKAATKVKFVEICSDGSHEKVLPSIPTYILSGGAWTYLGSGSKNGELNFPADSGSTASIYAMATGNRYTSSYKYEHIKAGSQDQTIKFVLGSKYDDYCFPEGEETGATGGDKF